MKTEAPAAPFAPPIPIRPGQRILLVDDRLRDARGHQLGFVGGLAAWLAAAGAEVEIWAHRAFDPGLGIPPATVRRLFTVSWAEAFVHSGRRTRLLAILAHNLRFFRVAQAAGWLHPRDLVIATEATVLHLLAWSVWLRLAPRRTHLLLVFVQPPWMLDYAPGDGTARPKRQAVLYRWALRLIARDLRSGRCRLAADSAAVAGFLRDGGRWPVADILVPASEALRRGLEVTLPPRERGLRLGVLGRPVRERGFDRALAAIEQTCRAGAGGVGPAIVFVVQWHADPEAHEEDRHDLERLVREFPERVQVVDSAMDDAAYAALIGSLHGGLVPYARSAYANRASSVAMQLLSAGRPFVTTAGTWMATEQAARGAGVTCGEAPSEIAAAVATFAADYDALAAGAWARRLDARAYYSWPGFFARTGLDLGRTAAPA